MFMQKLQLFSVLLIREWLHPEYCKILLMKNFVCGIIHTDKRNMPFFHKRSYGKIICKLSNLHTNVHGQIHWEVCGHLHNLNMFLCTIPCSTAWSCKILSCDRLTHSAPMSHMPHKIALYHNYQPFYTEHYLIVSSVDSMVNRYAVRPLHALCPLCLFLWGVSGDSWLFDKGRLHKSP